MTDAEMEALKWLARHDDIRAQILLTGGTQALIPLLNADSDEVKVLAVDALAFLTCVVWRHNNVATFASSGGIAALIALLSADSDRVKVKALEILRQVMHCDGFVAMFVSGGIEAFIALLGSDSDEVRVLAASALDDLMHAEHLNWTTIPVSGAVRLLIAMLSGSDEVKEAAAGALATMAWRAGLFRRVAQEAAAREAEAARKVVEEAETARKRAEEAEAACIAVSGAIPSLNALLGGSGVVKEQTERALEMLSAPEAGQDANRGRKKMKTAHDES